MKRNIILIIVGIIALVLMLMFCVGTEATTEKEYDIITVESVYTTHNHGKVINTWYLEYDGNVYVYTNLNYPVTTRYLLADVSGYYPIVLDDINVNRTDKKTNIASRTDVVIGVVKENNDGEVLKEFEIVENKNGNTTIHKEYADDYYNYISYRGVDCNKGDVICTICDMETENFEPDDILNRTDKVIAKCTKK